MSLDRSTVYFVQMVLGACVLFAALGTFVAYHDKDWKFEHKENVSEAPPGADSIDYYSTLSAEERRIVRNALDGSPAYVETRQNVPAEVIRTSFDNYMIFNGFAVFDWLNPVTILPIVGGIAGIGTLVDSIRRDIRHRGL